MGSHLSPLLKLLIRAGVLESRYPAVSSIVPAMTNVTEGSGNLAAIVYLAAYTTELSIYPVRILTAGDTAALNDIGTAGYSHGVTRVGNSLYVPPGVIGFTVSIPTLADPYFEGNESVTLKVGVQECTFYITNNDTNPSVTAITAESGAEGTVISHTVTVTGQQEAPFTATFSVNSGTATLGSDITSAFTNANFTNGVTLSDGLLTIPSGVTSFQVRVNAIDDILEEGVETYSIGIGSVFGTGTILASDQSAAPAFTATLNALSGATGTATANIFMTGSSGGGGVITAKASASRLTGVAPLYVNFDATETTSTQSTNPSHELFFAWDFGDPTAGTWANGVQSPGLNNKNTAYGPVVGHVFETPGTYVVTPVVVDGDPAHTASRTKTIIVQDPNVVYAGALTICISHSGNFTGAPAGATQITAGNTDMYAAWNTHKASNKRILFCKADAWTCSAAMTMAGLTGTTVSGYGTGVAHTFASGTLASVTLGVGATSLFECGGSTDCRVCNFKIAAAAPNFGMSVSSADSVALTLYKIEVRGATAGFSTTATGNGAAFTKHDQHCVYECLVDNVYGYAGVNPPLFTGASGAVGAPGIFTATGHPFKQYNRVQLTGTPPAGLSTGTNYYISAANLTANTFSLSSTFGPDTPVAISGASTCDVTAQPLGGGIGAFVAMSRGGFMGNYLDSCNYGEQTLRMPYVHTVHVNNNYIARPNQGKNVFKIHCRGYDDIYLAGVTSGYSEKIVVTANVMDLRGGYSYGEAIPNNGRVATGVGTSDIVIGNGGVSPGGERVRDAIIENNFTYTCLGYAKDSNGFAAIGCPNVTVRNNIADLSKGSNRAIAQAGNYPYTGMYFVSIGSSTTQERTAGVRIYNNTSYSNLSDSETANFVYIQLPSVAYMDVDDVQIKNNIWYYPFAITTSKSAYRLSALASPTNVVATNNTDSVAGGAANNTPDFVATPPVLLTDWRPNTGSYAINSGATVPVLKDFGMASRVGGTYDLGAVLP